MENGPLGTPFTRSCLWDLPGDAYYGAPIL
jgi:hypothetical protein